MAGLTTSGDADAIAIVKAKDAAAKFGCCLAVLFLLEVEVFCFLSWAFNESEPKEVFRLLLACDEKDEGLNAPVWVADNTVTKTMKPFIIMFR